LCAAPFLAAVKLVGLLRVPVLDAQLIESRSLKPDILAPMRIINPSSDARVAADMMTQWARGDVIDLWRPTPASVQAHFGGSLGSTPSPPSPPVTGSRKDPGKGSANQPRSATESQAPQLASGTELIDAGRSRAPGTLKLANHTNLEAIVRVVSDRSTRRAVYIRPGESAVIRSVRIGVYDLHVELGNDLDVAHLRFRRNSYIPDPLGPFEFLEITSENGVSGKHYDVALNAR
jgi:hypothetical protein